MRRLAKSAVALLLAAAAPTSAAILILPREPQFDPLPVREQAISVDITERAARTTWKSTFFNPNGRDLEGTFLFTLPPGAQVSDFTIKLDGKELHGEVLPKEQARSIYEGIVRKMRDPGLLEQVDGQTMRVEVFPLKANQTSDVTIEYLETLPRDGDLFHFEIAQSFPAGTHREATTTLSVKLHGTDALGAIQSPTHEVSVAKSTDGKEATVTVNDTKDFDGHFVLLYGLAQNQLGLHLMTSKPPGAEEGAFLLMVVPPATGALAEPMRKDVVFVLDTSGSMADEGELDKAKAALRQCLQALNKEDGFGLVGFSTGVDAFRPEVAKATDENLKAAQAWIEARRARGGTNISGALEKAKTLLTAAGADAPLRQVIFFTDGQPTVGRTDKVQLLDMLPKPGEQKMRIFTLGFGYDVNAQLLDSLALGSGAFSDYIHPKEDLELSIASLFRAVSSPVLTDVKVEYTGVQATEQFPAELPELFLGRELLVAGSYKGAGKGTITLTGKANGKDYRESVDVDFPDSTTISTDYVRAIWANRKVAYLIDQIRAHGESQELKDEVMELAREFNLVTPYTSFLAAPDDKYVAVNSVRGVAPSASGYNPTDGTVSLGDISNARPQVERRYRMLDAGSAKSMQEAAGESAVNFSEYLNAQREQQKAPASAAVALRRKGNTTMQQLAVGGQNYTQNSAGAWVNATKNRPAKTVQVRYLSKAYFELLERYPAYRSQILIGENVQLPIANAWVEIGDAGVEEKLPEL